MAISAIATGLFELDGDRPRLIGGRRKSDGRIVFPLPQGAEAEQFDAVHLASAGSLWSFTVQRFRPKSPPYAGADDERSFRPFALGYVELPEQVIVEARIEVDDPSRLRIGMPMQLAVSPFARTGGEPALICVFKPVV